MSRAIGCAILIAVGGIAAAIGPEEPFADPALESEYQALIREVRCLVCQNQTIADSSAPLASDLRREIRELMAAGASRDDVSQFLVERYGDFVLYRPPLQPTTWALWGAPAALLLLGLIVFARVVRARLQQPLGEDLPPQ
ncbi:MAG: cytochrome c-type biogenesis protein CcmH [Gammaproteobacteria bacterium]|nr:cytochrome c-type biogenesis protein CcmH [Gammaproteobacteria bacterium]